MSDTNSSNKTIDRNEARTLALLLGRFRSYWHNIRPRIDNYKDYYKTAQFHRDSAAHGYKYNIHKPIAFLLIRSFVSGIVNAIFERTKDFEVTPTERANFVRPEIKDELIARQLEKVLNHYSQNPDMNYYEEIENVVEGMGYYGNGISWILPKFDRDTKEGLEYKGFKLRYLDPYDFVPNPHIVRLEPGVDFFIREKVSFEELERRQREQGYKNVDQVKNDEFIPDDIKRELFSELGLESMITTGIGKKGRILLLHYVRSDGHFQTIAANRIIVLDTSKPRQFDINGEKITTKIKPFPYFPFDNISMNSGPQEFYGIGIAQVAKQAQDLINIRTSQRLENIEVVLRKPLLVNYLFDLDIDNLHTGPGHVILTNDIDRAIRPLEFNDITSSTYAGVNQITRGAMPGGRITATTTTQLLQQSQRRTSTELRKMSIYLSSIARKVAVQIRTYLTQSQYERILGEPDAGFYLLTPKEINDFLDIRPASISLDAGRSQKIQEMIQFAQSVAGVLPPEGMLELVKDIAKEMFPDRNPEKYVQLPAAPDAPPAGVSGQGVVPGEKGTNIPQGQNFLTNPEQIQGLVAEGRLGGQQGLI